MSISWIVLGVLAFFVFLVVTLFNKLVRLRNLVKNSFAQIDVQLKRRYDLIPNLVETAKAYMKHERETLEAVIQARNSAYNAEAKVASDPTRSANMKELLGAEAVLGQVMTKFMALAEAYPDLKANQNMKQLSEELTSSENKVAFARQAYNDSVMEYNNARETFPSNMLAGMFGFQESQPFEITNAVEKEVVRVSF